ncbi:MAG: YgeY family selenium metabolism-linked hydrolase, partial [Ignavibacteriaceae bacterium]|nr:YgeY family selenium metabolism-linked hydrolase [Ignavibacteriaceae bacterium]
MELSEVILKKANEYSEYTASNLSKLIQIKSLSSEEKEVVTEIVRMMEEAGFDEVRIDGLGNAIGRIGNGKKIIAVDGHIDT